jgi:hypothetical protein
MMAQVPIGDQVGFGRAKGLEYGVAARSMRAGRLVEANSVVIPIAY